MEKLRRLYQLPITGKCKVVKTDISTKIVGHQDNVVRCVGIDSFKQIETSLKCSYKPLLYDLKNNYCIVALEMEEEDHDKFNDFLNENSEKDIFNREEVEELKIEDEDNLGYKDYIFCNMQENQFKEKKDLFLNFTPEERFNEIVKQMES